MRAMCLFKQKPHTSKQHLVGADWRIRPHPNHETKGKDALTNIYLWDALCAEIPQNHSQNFSKYTHAINILFHFVSDFEGISRRRRHLHRLITQIDVRPWFFNFCCNVATHLLTHCWTTHWAVALRWHWWQQNRKIENFRVVIGRKCAIWVSQSIPFHAAYDGGRDHPY